MQKKKAVSLIVLVITIIVMIILAGAIILTLEKTNIINIAASATDSVEIASEKETIQMAVILAESTNKTGRITKDKIQKSIDELTAENSAKVYDLDGNFIIIFESKRAYTIDSNGEVLGMQEDYQNQGKVFLAQVSDSTYGTAEKPYEIKCIEDLVDLSYATNGIEVLDDGTLSYTASMNRFSDKYISLIQNLDFASELSYEDATRTDYGDINGNGKVESLLTELTTGTGWVPINSFWANFDGTGKQISNLYINNEEVSKNVALFSSISYGDIMNLAVSGNIYCNANVAGGIVAVTGYQGENHKIENCKFSGVIQNMNTNRYAGGIVGEVSGGAYIVINSYNEGTVRGGARVGGIIGSGGNLVKNCYNTGEISGSNYVGGIVGFGSLNIENCYNTGKVSSLGNSAGGIQGVFSWGDGKVYRCYNTGDISSKSYSGGIVGQTHGNNNRMIEQCYNSGNISGDSYVAGICGYIYQNGINKIINCYNIGSLNGTKAVAGIVGDGGDASTNVVSCYNIGKCDISDFNGIRYNMAAYNSYYLLSCGATDKNATSVEETVLKASASILDKKYTINEEDNTVTISENEIQDVWVEDTNNINYGYPIFRWQLSQSNSRRIKNIL